MLPHDDMIVGKPKMAPVELKFFCNTCGKLLTARAVVIEPPFTEFVTAGTCGKCLEKLRAKRKAEQKRASDRN